MTFQHAEFIEECLDSILMQETDFPFEIILGEDDSTDGTREICVKYANNHQDKIRLFQRDKKDKISIEGTVTERFNLLENLSASRAKYIAIMDGDDYWTSKTKLQEQVDFMRSHPECTLICHDTEEQQAKEGWYTLTDVFKVSFLPHTSNYLMKSFSIDKYREQFLHFKRADLLMLLIQADRGMVYHSKNIVSHYRINPQGVWSSMTEVEKLKSVLHEYEKVKRYFQINTVLYLRKRIRLMSKIKQLEGNPNMGTRLYQFFATLYRTLKKGPIGAL